MTPQSPASRRTDTRLVLLFFLLVLFGLGTANVFTFTATYSYLLTAFDSSVLPLIYVAAATIVPAAGALYLYCERRIAYISLLRGTFLTAACATALLWAGLRFGEWHWLVPVAAIYQQIEFVMGSLVVWGMAGRCFNIRETKEWFGRIGAGEPIGSMIGGLVVTLFIALATPADLLLLSSASSLASVIILGAIHRRRPVTLDSEHEVSEDADEDLSEALPQSGTPRRKFYVWSIFGLILAFNFSFYFVDSAFYMSAAERFPDTAEMAAFVGKFTIGVAAMSFLCTAALSSWLMTRVAFLLNLLLLPIVLLTVAGVGSFGAETGLLSAAAVFGVLVVLKGLDDSARAGLYQPVIHTLYQPLPASVRTRAQVVSESYVEQLATGIAGLSIYALVTWGEVAPSRLVLIAAAFLAAWAVLAAVAHRGYVQQLRETLAIRQLGRGSLDLGDPAVRNRFVQGLRSGRTGQILAILRMLEDAASADLNDEVLQLLDHADLRVRVGVCRYFERHGSKAAGARIEARLTRPDTALAPHALPALAACWKEESVDHLVRFLDSSDVAVRAAALLGLLQHGGTRGHHFARQRLAELRQSPVTQERLVAVTVLEQIDDPAMHAELDGLMDDADREVRHRALHAAGLKRADILIDSLVAALRRKADRRVAANALAKFGRTALPHLTAALEQDSNPFAKATVLPALARVAGEGVVDELVGLLRRGDPTLRHHALRALTARIRAGEDVATKHDWAAEVDDTLTVYASILAHRSAITDKAGRYGAALARALDRLAAGAREQMFLVASIANREAQVLDAWRRLHSGSDDQRAYAVEMLDNALPSRFRTALPALFEDLTETRQRHALRKWVGDGVGGVSPSYALDSARWATPWVRACADLHFRNETDFAQPDASAPPWLDGLATPETPTDEDNMTRLVETVLMLRAVDFFHDMPDAYLLDVAGAVKRRRYKAGEDVIRQGEKGSELFVLLSGRVSVLRNGRAIAELGDGEVFGEMAALDPEPRSATVRALEDLDLFVLTHLDLEELLEANPALGRGVIRILCRRLRSAGTPPAAVELAPA